MAMTAGRSPTVLPVTDHGPVRRLARAVCTFRIPAASNPRERSTMRTGLSESWKLESGARPAERRGLQRDRTTVQLGEIADDRETEP